MINDRRDNMSLAELVEELELSYPDKVADFERRYPDAMAAVAEEDLGACDPDELDDLASERLLRIWPGTTGTVASHRSRRAPVRREGSLPREALRPARPAIRRERIAGGLPGFVH
jgi:hypothetical protein